jgi:hypothetical protein
MKPSGMDDREPDLTEADRRGIAAIRRRLDEEFRRKLDADLGPLPGSEDANPVESRGRPRGRPRRETPSRPRSPFRRRAAVTVLTLAVIASAFGVASVVGVRYSGRDDVVRSETQAPAPDVETANEPEAVDDVAVLRDAVEEWIEATRRGDIPTQMRFYPGRVPVYYTWRDVPREAVRAEKVKVFGAASHLVITTDVPAIEVARDGLTGTTRFRKRYVIEGPVIRRRGEVLQELRWARTTDGWRIIGERDARVLRSG